MELLQIIIQRGIFNKSPPLLFYLIHGNTKKRPSVIEELRVSMRKLSQCWEGPAWATFQTQLNKDIQNMLEVYECLVELQKSLGEGRDIYLKTEFDVYTDLKGLWI